MFDRWINIVFPSEKKTPYGQIATDPDPGMSNSTRYYLEGNVLRSHALIAQQAFDEALALAMSGQGVKVGTYQYAVLTFTVARPWFGVTSSQPPVVPTGGFAGAAGTPSAKPRPPPPRRPMG